MHSEHYCIKMTKYNKHEDQKETWIPDMLEFYGIGCKRCKSSTNTKGNNTRVHYSLHIDENEIAKMEYNLLSDKIRVYEKSDKFPKECRKKYLINDIEAKFQQMVTPRECDGEIVRKDPYQKFKKIYVSI